MASFVLVPGSGGNAGYWQWLVAELERRGHEAIAVDIAEDDPALGLPEYAEIVRAAIGERVEAVLVAQSLGAFTAAMVAQSTPLAMLVLVNAMVPVPGETPSQWWDAVGAAEARHEAEDAAGRGHDFDVEWHFLDGLPDEVRAQLYADGPHEPADTPFGQPCEFERWPDVPIHAVVGRDDHFFPAAFQQRVLRDRLAIDADLLDGGHLLAAGNPVGLADLLERYLG